MRLLAPLLALLAALLLLPAPARASIANAPGANLEVYLVTYGPGDVYWERFGHDALELRDTSSGEAINFNYGVFDFNETNFFLNFARGRMHYLMDAEPTGAEEADYVDVGRSITRQRLALTPAQAGALRDFLFWNLRPENAAYPYDYYLDNCTTRVRDALDKALGGILKTRLGAQAGGLTYRQQTDRLMSAQPWLMLLLDLGLGPRADQPMNAWTGSFLPDELKDHLRSIQVSDDHGGTQPLVQDEALLSPNHLAVPPAQPPDLRLPLGVTGFIFAALLIATRRYAPALHASLATLWYVSAGLIGLLLLALWTLTSHHAAWANANLLLFSPLALLLPRAAWRARRNLAPSRLASAALIAQLAGLPIAAALHLPPGTVQQNQPWLLLALPVWLALAWSQRQATLG